MKSRYFRPVNRSKFCPRVAEVVFVCGRKEKQEIEHTSPALLHVYQILYFLSTEYKGKLFSDPKVIRPVLGRVPLNNTCKKCDITTS